LLSPLLAFITEAICGLLAKFRKCRYGVPGRQSGVSEESIGDHSGSMNLGGSMNKDASVIDQCHPQSIKCANNVRPPIFGGWIGRF